MIGYVELPLGGSVQRTTVEYIAQLLVRRPDGSEFWINIGSSTKFENISSNEWIRDFIERFEQDAGDRKIVGGRCIKRVTLDEQFSGLPWGKEPERKGDE